MPEQSNIRYNSALRIVSQLFEAKYSFQKELAATGNPYFFVYNDPSFVIFQKITLMGCLYISDEHFNPLIKPTL